jgi:hypothetical protein
VFERHGITLGEDDPAFALVTLNELILRQLLGELLAQVDEHLRAGLAQFEVTMQRAEGHAGKVLARQVRDSAGTWQGALRAEISDARISMQQMAEETQRRYRTASFSRWWALGAVVAVLVFASWFWAGRL